MNKFCHIEIPAPDLDAAVKFYTELFGWETQPMGPTYVFYQNDSVGGGFDADMKVSEGGCNLVIEVDDIPAKLKEIEAAGGKTVKEKTEIGNDFGFFASFLDINGNRLSLWSKK